MYQPRPPGNIPRERLVQFKFLSRDTHRFLTCHTAHPLIYLRNVANQHPFQSPVQTLLVPGLPQNDITTATPPPYTA